MTSIGFVGLGNMGQAMVARLLESGFDVSVWNRTADACDSSVRAGAELLAQAEDAFSKHIVISMLANDAAVEEVFSSDLLARHPDTLHINMASISLEAARKMEARHAASGVRYLGAPVLGRPDAASAGQLSILAGGHDADVDEAMPVLDALGKKVWHVSAEPAGANLVKIGVNYNLIHALSAMGESINLVERGGIDPQLFIDILSADFFSGVIYPTYGRIIAERDYLPAAFSAQLGLKDLTLAEKAATEVSAALPIAPALHELFDSAVGDERRRDADWSVIAEVIRDL